MVYIVIILFIIIFLIPRNNIFLAILMILLLAIVNNGIRKRMAPIMYVACKDAPIYEVCDDYYLNDHLKDITLDDKSKESE